MGELGFQELIFIGVILLFFFGPSKLPELGSGLGKAIKGFKSALNDTKADLEEPVEHDGKVVAVVPENASSHAESNTESTQEENVTSGHV